MKKLILLAVLISLTSAVNASKMPKLVYKILKDARQSVNVQDMDYLKSEITDNESLIIDVRYPEQYRAGHVETAINIPRGKLEYKLWKHVGHPEKINFDKELIVYCNTGKRSALAAKTIKDLGFTNITMISMKYEEWVEKNYPVDF